MFACGSRTDTPEKAPSFHDGVRAPAGEQVRLLSRECSYSSMAGCGEIGVAELGLVVHGLLKITQLPGRKDHEKGLEQDDGFPEAGIEVVVAGVDFMPPAFGVGIKAFGEVIGHAAEVLVEILNHFFKRADFMQELKPMRKEDSIEEPAHARGTLAARPLIVPGIKRRGVWNRPVMLGVFVQRPEGTGESASQPAAKLRTHAHGIQGLGQQPRESEFNGFVQRNTEHVIQRFETPFLILEYHSLIFGKACAPVFLHTSTAGQEGAAAGIQAGPPWAWARKYIKRISLTTTPL
jgi:hypothetical protein